jgi:hypothetical protein
VAEAEAGGVEAVLEAGEKVGRERVAAERLIEACSLWYRDLLCGAVGAGAHQRVFAEAIRRPREDRPFRDALDGLAACREAWQALQGNATPRLTVEVLLGRLQRASV